MKIDNKKYSNSKETMKERKISSCELMHLRVQGKLKFMKKGNAYYYESPKKPG